MGASSGGNWSKRTVDTRDAPPSTWGVTGDDYKALREKIGTRTEAAKVLGCSTKMIQKREEGQSRITQEAEAQIKAAVASLGGKPSGTSSPATNPDPTPSSPSSKRASSKKSAPKAKKSSLGNSSPESRPSPPPAAATESSSLGSLYEPYGEPKRGDDPVDPRHIPPFESNGDPLTRIADALERIADHLEGGNVPVANAIPPAPVAETIRETIAQLTEEKDHSAINHALSLLGFDSPPATYAEVNKRAKALLAKHPVDSQEFSKIQHARDRLYNEFFSESND